MTRFERDGRAKHPVFPFEKTVISLPFDRDNVRDAAPTVP